MIWPLEPTPRIPVKPSIPENTHPATDNQNKTNSFRQTNKSHFFANEFCSLRYTETEESQKGPATKLGLSYL